MGGSALKIAVIGAGWAGLAAAVDARSRGHAVTLLEMAPQIGGRARSVAFGDAWLDNGQHILIGAYVECLRLMTRVGVNLDDVLDRRPLSLIGPDGTGLRLGRGPALLAFARAVLSRRGWSFGDRIALLAAATGWAARGFRCSPQLTVAELTSRLPRALRDGLIDPLCVAALNTPADAASAAVFLRVLRDALFTAPGSADLLLPRAPLDALFPCPADAWLRAHGAEVHLSTRAESIHRSGAGWSVAHRSFDAVVLAASAVEAARLAKPHDEAWSRQTANFSYEPIITVYAQSDGARLPEPMLMLESDDTERPAQFVFDHGRLGGPIGRLAFVVSGAASWVERGTAAVTQATLAQAHSQLASHLSSPLIALRTLTEKRATFRCVPGLHRPRAALLPGLVAAGDYIDGPYPATLEGAVRSGVAAIRLLDPSDQRE